MIAEVTNTERPRVGRVVAPRVFIDFISFDTQTRECENTGGHTLAIGEFDIVTNLVQKQFLSRGGLR